MDKFAVGYFLDRQTIEWNNAQVIAARMPTALHPKSHRCGPRILPACRRLHHAGRLRPLHDEGLAYAEKLRQAGVKVTVADYGDMVHCFIYLQTVLPQAHEAVAAAAKAVRDALAVA